MNEIPITHHVHKCEKCGFLWSHSDECRGNQAAHTCPCGEEVWRLSFDLKKKDSNKLVVMETCESPTRPILTGDKNEQTSKKRTVARLGGPA